MNRHAPWYVSQCAALPHCGQLTGSRLTVEEKGLLIGRMSIDFDSLLEPGPETEDVVQAVEAHGPAPALASSDESQENEKKEKKKHKKTKKKIRRKIRSTKRRKRRRMQ